MAGKYLTLQWLTISVAMVGEKAVPVKAGLKTVF